MADPVIREGGGSAFDEQRIKETATGVVDCRACPLRALPLFIDQSVDEQALVQSLKRTEVRLGAMETLIH